MSTIDQDNWKSLTETNPFSVPKGYFADFQSNMMESIRGEALKPKIKKLNTSWIKWASSVAAVLLLGFIAFQQFYSHPTGSINQDQELYSLVEYFGNDLDDWSMTELVVENDLIVLDEPTDQMELLNWMDLDEMTLIEAVINEK